MASKDPLLYALLSLVVVLLLVSIAIQVSDRNDNLTSWATIKSNELHTFFKDCRSGGGSVDVRPNSAPAIVFLCEFTDFSREFTLSPGK